MSETNYWARSRRRRLSRRTLLGASARAGVGAAGLALVGCGDDDDDDDDAVSQVETPQEQDTEQAAEQQAEQQAQQAEAPAQEQAEEAPAEQAAVGAITRGGIFRQTNPLATHDYFDPHRGIFGPTQNWMGYYMNYLVRWQNKEKGVLESDIASLPEIPDEETYVFSVDQGARFWDQFPTEGGRLVTADDVRFNVQRNIDAVDASGAEDGTFVGATAYRRTASMDVIDDQTIQMKTNGPDATYLTSVFAGPFSWMTSPEAADAFGDRWRDETTNVELSSGTGQYIPVSFDPDTQLVLKRNPNHFRPAADGGNLPYMDGVEWNNILDPTAVEAAYRANQIDTGNFPLSKLQVDGIQADFPDHKQNQVAFGFVIVNVFNYWPDYNGEDGQGNPWLDRRVPMAWTAAQDRFFMGDTVYLGDFKLSALNATPWFNEFWAIPQDELLTIPGWRPDREADIAEARLLLDAAGFDRDFHIMMPDLWEATYPGITESTKAMYEDATQRTVNVDIQPYTVILQKLEEHTHPGSGPAWGNPPTDLDPTTPMRDVYLPGNARNFYGYDFQPVTDLLEEMTVTLNIDERRELGLRVQRILLGTDEEHGSEGFGPRIGTMNGIQRIISWPYVNTPADAFQFAHASHHAAASWLDTTHPDYPA